MSYPISNFRSEEPPTRLNYLKTPVRFDNSGVIYSGCAFAGISWKINGGWFWRANASDDIWVSRVAVGSKGGSQWGRTLPDKARINFKRAPNKNINNPTGTMHRPYSFLFYRNDRSALLWCTTVADTVRKKTRSTRRITFGLLRQRSRRWRCNYRTAPPPSHVATSTGRSDARRSTTEPPVSSTRRQTSSCCCPRPIREKRDGLVIEFRVWKTCRWNSNGKRDKT